MTTPINIKSLDCTDKHMVVWDGKICEIYEIKIDINNTKTN